MRSIVLVVLTTYFQLLDAQGAGKIYTGHGYFSNNCPITACLTLAASCPLGRYLNGCGATSTATGDCLSSCTNTLPANADWTSNGGLSATGCTWVCRADYDLVSGQCVIKQCASNGKALIANSEYNTDGTGAYSQCKYRCSAGYFPTGTAADGRGPASCTGCPAGTKVALGDISCSDCPIGTFSVANSGTCTPCPSGYFSTTTKTANTCSNCIDWYCNAGSWRQNCGGSTAGNCVGCYNTAFTVREGEAAPPPPTIAM